MNPDLRAKIRKWQKSLGLTPDEIDARLKDIHANHAKTARTIREQQTADGDTDSILPSVTMLMPSGDLGFFGLAFGGVEEKTELYDGIAKMARKIGALGLVLVNETFFVTYPKEDKVATAAVSRGRWPQDIPASRHPDRKEALLIVTVTRRYTRGSLYPFRTDDRTIVWEEAQEDLPGIQASLIEQFFAGMHA